MDIIAPPNALDVKSVRTLNPPPRASVVSSNGRTHRTPVPEREWTDPSDWHKTISIPNSLLIWFHETKFAG